MLGRDVDAKIVAPKSDGLCLHGECEFMPFNAVRSLRRLLVYLPVLLYHALCSFLSSCQGASLCPLMVAT